MVSTVLFRIQTKKSKGNVEKTAIFRESISLVSELPVKYISPLKVMGFNEISLSLDDISLNFNSIYLVL